MIAVIDTNVLASGLISPSGAPGKIVELIRAGELEPAVDDRILEEYEDVLRRDYLRRYFTIGDAELMLDFLVHASHYTVSERSVPDLPAPGDVPFIETALSAAVPLVTGNKRHFPAPARQGCDVRTPAEFLAVYFPPS